MASSNVSLQLPADASTAFLCVFVRCHDYEAVMRMAGDVFERHMHGHHDTLCMDFSLLLYGLAGIFTYTCYACALFHMFPACTFSTRAPLV